MGPVRNSARSPYWCSSGSAPRCPRRPAMPVYIRSHAYSRSPCSASANRKQVAYSVVLQVCVLGTTMVLAGLVAARHRGDLKSVRGALVKIA